MSSKTIHSIGIIMNGVTGRMGLNQHLRRSIHAIMQQGGVPISATETIMPRPLLVGRNAVKLESISREFGGIPWTTSVEEALANPEYSVYFDSQTTDRRVEAGKPYACTADDSAYATFELEDGIIAHFNSSWTVRVRRDDLLTLQVDGTKGSAVAGLRDCWVQPYAATPRPTWNPDVPQPIQFLEGWQKLPDQDKFDNAFKCQWELFLRHVVKDEPFRWGFLEAAKGVQLAEKGIESWEKRAWVQIPELK